MNRLARMAVALVLALASGAAAALGLGQLELKSKLGEPLLAEIAIISSDPAELERLRAGLASPATFARVGLEPPEGVVAGLQFVSALDARGRPVIRVTSRQPIEQPLLTFLVEVDWGQGRLVREYSALLDAPRTVSAPLQPSIEAPAAAPSNTIVREPEPRPRPAAAPEPAPTADDIAAAEPAADDDITPTAPTPAAPAAAPAPPQRPSQLTVAQGQTLSEIAVDLDYGTRLDQAMIALLAANPDAFIDGNIHRLRQGAVLRVPERADVQAVAIARAVAQVREQTRAWRAATAPLPQPALPADSEADTGTAQGAEAPSPDPATAATADARLEIVPPGANDATGTGTQSGLSAGGEGDAMRQELQQTRETLASREAELAELRSRVADLEALQSDQQKLLEMKDDELATAQQQLAQVEQADPVDPASGWPWLVGGALLLLLALLGGWWMRRKPAAPAFRAPSTSPHDRSASLAAVFPTATPVEPAPAAIDREEAAAAPQAGPAAVVSAPAADVDDEADLVAGTDIDSDTDTAPEPVPTWHAADAHDPAVDTAASDAASESSAADPSFGNERLELARAYLDLGDRDSARQLLAEVAVNGDHAARQHATRMLRELE